MKKRIIFISILVVLTIVIVGGVAIYFSGDTSVRQITRVELALRAEKFDKAMELVRDYIAEQPDDWYGYYLQARIHVRLGEYDQARPLLTNLLEQENRTRFAPDETKVRFLLADTHNYPARQMWVTTDITEDRELLRSFIDELRAANTTLTQIDAEDENTALNVDQAIGLNLIRIADALEPLATLYATELNLAHQAQTADKIATLEKQLASTQTATEQAREEATDKLLAVLKNDPQRAEAAEELAKLYFRQGIKDDDTPELNKIRTEVEKAVMAAETPSPTAQQLILWHKFLQIDSREEQRVAEVKNIADQLDQIIAAHPNQPLLDVKIKRAQLAADELSDMETAKKLIAEALESSPKDRNARLFEAYFLIKEGETLQTEGKRLKVEGKKAEADKKYAAAQEKFTTAEEKLYRLKTEFSKWPPAFHYYAMAARHTGKKEMARQAMRTVLEFDSGDQKALTYLAQSLYEDEFYDLAFEKARDLYREKPDDPAALEMFIDAAMAAGMSANARETLEDVRTKYANDAVMLMTAADSFGFDLNDQTEMLKTAMMVTRLEPKTPDGKKARAEAFRTIGNNTRAEAIYDEQLKRDPENADIHFGLGKVYLQTGRTLQAVDAYQEAVRLEPTNEMFRLALARTLYDIGNLEASARQVARLEPSYTAADDLRKKLAGNTGRDAAADDSTEKKPGKLLEQAVSYLESGWPNECNKLCRQILETEPDNVKARLLSGRAYQYTGEIENSREQWRKALKETPHDISVYLNVAKYLTWDMDTADAVRYLENLQKTMKELQNRVDTDDMLQLARGWFHHQKGILYQQNGQVQPARRQYDQALTIYDKLKDDIFASSVIRNEIPRKRLDVLIRSGHYPQAQSYLDELMQQSETPNQWRRLRQAQLCLVMQRVSEAEAIINDLRQRAVEEKNIVLFKELIDLYDRTRQPDKAIALCEEGVTVFPEDADLHFKLGNLLAGNNQFDAAVESYRQAIRYRPGFLRTYHELAEVLNEQHEHRQVVDLLESLKNDGKKANITQAAYSLTMFYNSWGLQKQALENVEQLSSLGYDNDPKIQLLIARSFAACGQKERAKNALQKISVHAPEYVEAQLELAKLAKPSEKLTILQPLTVDNPHHIPILVETMHAYLATERPDEALKVLRNYIEDHSQSAPLPWNFFQPTLEALLEADDREAAVDLMVKIGREKQGQGWLQLAVLTAMDSRPEAAETMLPAPENSGFVDAFLGLCLACREDSAVKKEQWSRQLEYIDQQLRQRPGGGSIPPSFKILQHLALGEVENAKEIQENRIVDTIVDQGAASELIAHYETGNAQDEVLTLMKATIALLMEIQPLTQKWALGQLEKRPASQWAAALAINTEEDADLLRQVQNILVPKNCYLAQLIRARLLFEKTDYEQALEIYNALAKSHPGQYDLIFRQALTLENAGKLENAMELYRKLWQTTRNPLAANNIALLILKTAPDDKAKVAEAEKLATEAVKDSHGDPAFRDTRAWVAYHQGNYEQACKELRLAVKMLTNSLDIHYHLARAEAAAGNRTLSQWHFEAVRRIGDEMLAAEENVKPEIHEMIEQARQSLEKDSQNLLTHKTSAPGSESN